MMCLRCRAVCKCTYGAALFVCEQYSSVGPHRVVLEESKGKGPQYVPVITGNGFGTNFAFIGKGDGKYFQTFLCKMRSLPSAKSCYVKNSLPAPQHSFCRYVQEPEPACAPPGPSP